MININLILGLISEPSVDKSRISLQNRCPKNVDQQRLLETASFVMSELGLHPATEVSITLVSLAEMERLHILHMDEPGPTDVLSFPFDELRAPHPGEIAQPGNLGDIVLCPEFALKQAQENNQSMEAELDLLLTHGILHCLGHDHYEPAEHELMFGIQGSLLSKLAEMRGSK